MSERLISLSKRWETDTDICSCELLKYVAELEDKLHSERNRVIDQVMGFYKEENTSPCMKCGAQSCAICGYEFLNFLHKLKDKRRHK